MPSEPYVTRREIGILKAEADAERKRIRKLLAEMRKDMNDQFAAHREEHQRDEARRTSARRWLVGSIIAAIAAVDGPLVTILLARR